MESGAELIYGLGALILMVSALAARRISLGETLRLGLAWIAIFAFLFAIFSFRPEIKLIWERVKSDWAGTANQNVVGNDLRLTRGDDGHFSVQARVNGKAVNFLVDSGATTTTISGDTANQIGLEIDRSAFPVILSTANGNSQAWRATLNNMRVENITISEHNILVSDTLGDINLLGMNFLDELNSWRVEGAYMILEP